MLGSLPFAPSPSQMKDLEAERRKVLREFMISANAAIGNSWSKLRTLCGPAMDSANAVDASRGVVDREVAVLAAEGMEEKVRTAERLAACRCCGFAVVVVVAVGGAVGVSVLLLLLLWFCRRCCSCGW